MAPRFSLRRYVAETWEGADLSRFRLCGMDEVGRGAYAGPLVAGATVMPHRFRHPLLKDSKQLTALQRETMAEIIRRVALAWAIVEIPAAQINERGIVWANREVFRLLVDRIEADGYCSDGNLKIGAARPVHTLVKGDCLIPAISAASIIAKVHRDAIMVELSGEAPHYRWESNKGYGAAVHRAAIKTHGPHEQHRTVWVRNLMQGTLFDEEFDAGAAALTDSEALASA